MRAAMGMTAKTTNLHCGIWRAIFLTSASSFRVGISSPTRDPNFGLVTSKNLIKLRPVSTH